MPGTSIKCLPDELQVEIVRHLSGASTTAPPSSWHREKRFRPKDLLPLLRCSKHYRTLTEPVLYSIFQQHKEDIRSLPLFLRTILGRPELTRYVMAFVGSLGENISEIAVMTKDECSRAHTALQDVTWSRRMYEDWAYCMGLGNNRPEETGRADLDVLNAFVISLLPNLESIELNVYVNGRNTKSHQRIRSVLDRAMNLQERGHHEARFAMAKVRTVSLNRFGPGRPRLGMPFRLVWPFLSLPSVETFSCDGVEEWPDMTASPQLLSSKPSKITSIAFHDSNMRPGNLLHLGKLFPKLNRLSYAAASYDPSTPWFMFSPSQFTDGIANLHGHLEVLSVTQVVPQWDFGQRISGVPLGSLHSLTSFKTLKVLEASAHILIGEAHFVEITSEDWQESWLELKDDMAFSFPNMKYPQSRIDNLLKNIPQTLEHLTITDCNSAIFDAVSTLLQSDLPPTLRSIMISFGPGEVMDYAELDNTFRYERHLFDTLASKRGIRMEWKRGALI